MTKKEIVKDLSERHRLSQVDTKLVVQGTFDAIMDAIVQHGRIELRNFGVFEVKQRAARKARNPRTGEEVHVPPKKVVVFKPGRLMEERVVDAPVAPDVPAGAGADDDDEDDAPVPPRKPGEAGRSGGGAPGA